MTRMDCETFDLDVVDLLYEDGDEGAREVLALHAASCARCGATLASLRAARDQAARLPQVAPPEGLAARIVAAEAAARRPPPLSRRVARAASWAGSLAMRPQLAMAALFCLAVGSSLLLLRARSDSVPGPTSVREAGLPTPAEATLEPEGGAARALSSAPAARSPHRGDATGRTDDGGDRASADPRRDPAEAPAPAAEATAAPSAAADATGDEAERMLAAALGRLRDGGCDAAAGDLEKVVLGFEGTSAADRAARELAGCRPSASAARSAAKSEPATAPPATTPPAGGPPAGARPPAKPEPAPDGGR